MRRIPRYLRFLVILIGLLLAGCGSSSLGSDEKIPVVTSSVVTPVSDVVHNSSEVDESSVTVASSPPVTDQMGATTTTLSNTEISQPAAPTTMAATTTSAPTQTVLPDAETFEPDAPQSGFITYEPDS